MPTSPRRLAPALATALLAGCATAYVQPEGPQTATLRFRSPHPTLSASFFAFAGGNEDCRGMQRIGGFNDSWSRTPLTEARIPTERPFVLLMSQTEMTANGFSTGMRFCWLTLAFEPRAGATYVVDVAHCSMGIAGTNPAVPDSRVPEPSVRRAAKQCRT